MKLTLVSLYDRSIKAYDRPLAVPNVGMAKVQLYGLVNTPDDNEPLYTNPEQFVLYNVGEFCTDTGTLTVLDPSEIVMECEFLRDESLHENNESETGDDNA